MSINNIFLISIVLGWLFFGKVQAQSTFRLGLLPSVNVNYKISSHWSANFKIESRQLLQSGTFHEEGDMRYEYLLTDYSMIVARKVGLKARLAAGYLFRFEEDQSIHRFIQQYTITRKWRSLRLSHRLVSDQTFSGSDDPEFRLRYRLATEFPLNGQSTDPGEFYIKLGHEYLNSVQRSAYDLEIRLVPMLGFAVKNNQKLELGMDYRVNSIFTGNSRHSFWICLNWYVDI